MIGLIVGELPSWGDSWGDKKFRLRGESWRSVMAGKRKGKEVLFPRKVGERTVASLEIDSGEVGK